MSCNGAEAFTPILGGNILALSGTRPALVNNLYIVHDFFLGAVNSNGGFYTIGAPHEYSTDIIHDGTRVWLIGYGTNSSRKFLFFFSKPASTLLTSNGTGIKFAFPSSSTDSFAVTDATYDTLTGIIYVTGWWKQSPLCSGFPHPHPFSPVG